MALHFGFEALDFAHITIKGRLWMRSSFLSDVGVTRRQVSWFQRNLVQVQRLEIPPEGLVMCLKKFAGVKVFCPSFKNVRRYYILFLPRGCQLGSLGKHQGLSSLAHLVG